MKLEGDNEYIINRIVYWLEQIDQLKEIKRYMMSSSSRNPLRLRKKVSFVISWGREIEMTQEQTCYIADGVNNYIDHLQNMIDEQNKELVEIARLIHEGKITKKGR